MTRRTLVARLDSMGDVLLAGPAVRAVARESEVVMLCGPRGAAAAGMLPGVGETIVWDAPWIADPAPPATEDHVDELVRTIRDARIDDAVILTSFHQSPLPLALLLRLAGVRRIAGASVDYPGSLLDVRVRPGEDLPEDLPEPERALAIAEAAGFATLGDRLLKVRGVADASPLTGSAPYVVVHPGAAVPARRWPAERFAQTVDRLLDEGRRVVITGGSDERDLARAIVRADPRVVDLAGRCDLPQLAGVLAGADVVVVGNTGPAHLAAAVGAPVVSLFSPVVPRERWAPYGVPAVVLGDQAAACRGTRARVCPVPGHPCLADVTADEVVEAIAHLDRERHDRVPPRAAAPRGRKTT